MPWVSPTTRSSGYTVTAANWNELVNNFLFLKRVAYTEATSGTSVTATTVGTAQQIVSAGAGTYEAVPHIITFYSPRISTGGTGAFYLILRDSTTVLGTLGWFPTASEQTPVIASRILTPTAASHTYNVAGWNAAAQTTTVRAGSGGTAGDSTTLFPLWISVNRIPT